MFSRPTSKRIREMKSRLLAKMSPIARRSLLFLRWCFPDLGIESVMCALSRIHVRLHPLHEQGGQCTNSFFRGPVNHQDVPCFREVHLRNSVWGPYKLSISWMLNLSNFKTKMQNTLKIPKFQNTLKIPKYVKFFNFFPNFPNFGAKFSHVFWGFQSFCTDFSERA